MNPDLQAHQSFPIQPERAAPNRCQPSAPPCWLKRGRLSWAYPRSALPTTNVPREGCT
jgi:hypothetical protein